MYDEAKAQMVRGLDGYKNEPWDFGAMGLIDTMNVTKAADAHKPKLAPGGFGEFHECWQVFVRQRRANT